MLTYPHLAWREFNFVVWDSEVKTIRWLIAAVYVLSVHDMILWLMDAEIYFTLTVALDMGL